MPIVALAFILGGMFALGRLGTASGAEAFAWTLLLLALIAVGFMVLQ